MAKKITDEGRPSKRMVESLFKSLEKRTYYGENKNRYTIEYEQLSEELDALESELLSDQRYQNLKKQKEVAYRKSYDMDRARYQEVLKVRRKYLANGITDQVLRELDKLVEKYTETSKPEDLQ